MILDWITIAFSFILIILLSISFYIAIFHGAPFVPTPLRAVHEILKNAGIKNGDRLYDLGAGDGRFIHFAAKDYGARTTGFEMDPLVFGLSRLRKTLQGWKGQMIFGNFMKHDLSDADFIICYLLPETLEKYQSKFEKELKKGTKIISYAFHVGSLKPKKIIPRQKGISQIFIYEI